MREDTIRLILIAPIPPPYGGIANWTLLMENNLNCNQHVELRKIINTAPSKRSVDGRTLWDRVVVQGFEMFKTWKELRQAVKIEKPDVIHMTTSGQLSIIRDILLLKTAKKLKIPTVYHLRFGRIPDIAIAGTKEWSLLKKAIRLATKTIAIDARTYNTLRAHFDELQICKIPNPYDSNLSWKILSESTDKYCEKNKMIMFLGWCIKTKGIEELLKAWSNIRAAHLDWNLQIVGPCGKEYSEYLYRTYSMDNVILTGEKQHEEALRILMNADIFILPSYTEGFPNVILEAMAFGKPIIATDVGAIKEMLGDQCGILITPQSVSEIESALIMLMSDEELQKTLGQNALNRLQSNYLADKVINRYVEVWDNLSGNGQEFI